jgi:hypothetical protein
MAKRINLPGKITLQKCETVNVQATCLPGIIKKHGYHSEYFTAAWDWPAEYFQFGLGNYRWAEHKQN